MGKMDRTSVELNDYNFVPLDLSGCRNVHAELLTSQHIVYQARPMHFSRSCTVSERNGSSSIDYITYIQ